MTVDQIEDRLAIRELIETFAVGAMRKDSAIWGSTWAEDCTWTIDILDEPVVGKANVVAIFERLIGNIKAVSMLGFPSELVIEGDTAHGKTYSQEMIFPVAGGQRILLGCFTDEYVKRDGRWYFRSRDYSAFLRSPMPPE